MTKAYKYDAEEAELDVAEKTPSAESLTAHLRYYSSESGCELAMA
jgi:hypothetical protein